jgi:hypothetical protein
VNLFVTKVEKCNQRSVLASVQKNLIHYNCAYCQKATDEKDDLSNWPMNKIQQH